MLEGHLSFPKTLSKAENILGRQLRVGVQSVQTQTSLVMLYQATAQTGLNPNPVITKKHLFTKYFHCYSVGAAGEQGQQSTTKSKFSHSYLAVRRSWAHPLSFSHCLRADKREITAFMHWTWCPPHVCFYAGSPWEAGLGSGQWCSRASPEGEMGSIPIPFKPCQVGKVQHLHALLTRDDSCPGCLQHSNWSESRQGSLNGRSTARTTLDRFQSVNLLSKACFETYDHDNDLAKCFRWEGNRAMTTILTLRLHWEKVRLSLYLIIFLGLALTSYTKCARKGWRFT